MLSPTNPVGPIMFLVKSLREEINNLYIFIIVKHFSHSLHAHVVEGHWFKILDWLSNFWNHGGATIA